MPSFMMGTLKLSSRPTGFPVSFKYVTNCASWTGSTVDRLGLEAHGVFHNHGEPVGAIEFHASVHQGRSHIDVDPESLAPKFDNQACEERGLQQAWSEGPVDGDGARDDFPS